MAITTGGGVAFSESANSRANREQLLGQMNQAQSQMQQESQFKRKQALDTANQAFGQEIQMGLASGNLEKYIAEHPQNFASIEQMMSGAIGRKVTMAEALQQGLGASSAGFAENPSLQRMTYEYLQRLPGQAAAPATDQTLPAQGGTQGVSNVPSPPGPGATTTRQDTGVGQSAGSATYTPAGQVAVDPLAAKVTDPDLQGFISEALKGKRTLYDSEAGPRRIEINTQSGKPMMIDIPRDLPEDQFDSYIKQAIIDSAYNKDDKTGVGSAWNEYYGRTGGNPGEAAARVNPERTPIIPPASAVAIAAAQDKEGVSASGPTYTSTPKGVKDANTLAVSVLNDLGVLSAANQSAWVNEFSRLNPEMDIRNIGQEVILPQFNVVEKTDNIGNRARTGPYKALEFKNPGTPSEASPSYEGGKSKGQPISQAVGAPVATFTQGTSSDVLSQAEQAGRAILDSRREQTTTPEAPVTRTSTPSSLYISGTTRLPGGTPKPGAFIESQITKDAAAAISGMPKIVTPKATAALGKIELNTSAPDTTETPFYDAKQAEIATAKFQDSFTKAVDLTKSLMSGDASKSLKQSDKAALAAAQTRAMALSDKIKGMDEGEYQKVRSEYVKWLESATPMELQAAGLPEVATKAESVWLARFQANAAIEAARARGGSETAAALIDMRGKAMDQVRGILEIANTAAKNDPNYKGDIAQFFQKNPMYRDMMVPFASMAFGQPVSIDMIMKDPTWFQKLMKQPGNVQGMGVSVNNWEGGRTTQATGTAPAVEKYYSKP